MYINSTNIPPIMIINRIYETKSSVAVVCFLPGRAKDLSAPRYIIPCCHYYYFRYDYSLRQFQWPRGLRRGSAAACLLGLRVRIPPEAWKFVCCECCVLSGKGLCDELITRTEESFRVWCVCCDHESSIKRRPCPTGGCCAMVKKLLHYLNG